MCDIIKKNSGGRLRTTLKVTDASVTFSREVAEWLKATVLKTVDPKGFVGSNPTLSLFYKSYTQVTRRIV